MCGCCPGGLKGRDPVAFTVVVEQALFERSENILLNDRERVEGFQRTE